MIEITFIEDKIYELNKKGESALTPEKDRIRMRVRKVSGEVVKIDDSELGWEQSKDMDLTNFTKVSMNNECIPNIRNCYMSDS